jgi:hypothetical protein
MLIRIAWIDAFARNSSHPVATTMRAEDTARIVISTVPMS